MLGFYLSMLQSEDDRDKITFIYKKFYSFMYHTAEEVLTHSKIDIEDAVHNAILKIIDIIDVIDTSDVKRVRNLCGIIAKNKAIDHCKLKDNQTLSLDDITYKDFHKDMEDKQSGDPYDIMVTQNTMDHILKAIDLLDTKYKDICMLKYVHRLKEHEIASLLDMSPKTVSTRIFRGKQIIREYLVKEDIHV